MNSVSPNAAAAARSHDSLLVPTSREDGASVPIIAMTANAFAEDVEQARAAGMNAHVAKPIDPDELRRVTGKFLAGREENKP